MSKSYNWKLSTKKNKTFFSSKESKKTPFCKKLIQKRIVLKITQGNKTQGQKNKQTQEVKKAKRISK